MRGVPPSERTQKRIEALLSGVGEEGDLKSELVRLAVEKIVEEALEAKVRDLVGRDYYARRDEGAHGYRNGYRRGRLKTSEGEVEYAVPPSPRRPHHQSLERLFVEDRRRMKPIAVFFGERPVLKLMHGTLLRAAETWRGLTITDLEREHLTRLWEQLDRGWKRAVVPADEQQSPSSTPQRISSKKGT